MSDITRDDAAVVDEAGFSVRRTIRIDAPIRAVWQAVTEPEHISRWFGRTALTGTGVSPGIGETLAILGRASALARIQRCLDIHRS